MTEASQVKKKNFQQQRFLLKCQKILSSYKNNITKNKNLKIGKNHAPFIIRKPKIASSSWVQAQARWMVCSVNFPDGNPVYTLTFSPSTSTVLIVKSTPIVGPWVGVKNPFVNLFTRHVFPTFASPISIILNR